MAEGRAARLGADARQSVGRAPAHAGPARRTRSVVHAVFTLERTYDAPVERVYRALSDEAAKAKWFGGSDGQWRQIERSMDFRVGGRERVKGRWESGVVSTFDAVYHDIVPNERIVYTYEMQLDEKKISVSLATMQIKPAGPGRTTLKVTEQGAFLDGYDDAGSRERGTAFLLDKLGASLAARAPPPPVLSEDALRGRPRAQGPALSGCATAHSTARRAAGRRRRRSGNSNATSMVGSTPEPSSRRPSTTTSSTASKSSPSSPMRKAVAASTAPSVRLPTSSPRRYSLKP